jgi:hypothetical protein
MAHVISDLRRGARVGKVRLVGTSAGGCGCSPAKLAASVLGALTGVPAKESIEFTGGNRPVSSTTRVRP